MIEQGASPGLEVLGKVDGGLVLPSDEEIKKSLDKAIIAEFGEGCCGGTMQAFMHDYVLDYKRQIEALYKDICESWFNKETP